MQENAEDVNDDAKGYEEEEEEGEGEGEEMEEKEGGEAVVAGSGRSPWIIGAGGAVTCLSTEDGEWEEMCGKLWSTMGVFARGGN